MKTLFLILGAAVGGVAGYFLYIWIGNQGLRAPVIPGAMIGFGAALARYRCVWLSLACGLAALGMGIFCEWKFYPFSADQSLSYFLSHLSDLKTVVIIGICLGGVLGFYLPFRSGPKVAKVSSAS